MRCRCNGNISSDGTYYICSACPPGTYASRTSSSSNLNATGQCTPCLPWTYTSSAGQSSCLATSVCAPGFFESTAPTQSSNRRCTRCTLNVSYTPEVRGDWG